MRRDRVFMAFVAVLFALLGWLGARIVRERDECMAKACDRGKPVSINGLCVCAEVPR